MEGLNTEQELTAKWLFERGNDIRRSLIKASSLEERLVDLEPEQVLGMYKPEERVGGLKPEQIVEAYKPEEKRLLLEALQRSLEMDEASE